MIEMRAGLANLRRLVNDDFDRVVLIIMRDRANFRNMTDANADLAVIDDDASFQRIEDHLVRRLRCVFMNLFDEATN